METVIKVLLNEHQELSLEEWHAIAHAFEEWLSTSPRYHTLEFDVLVEEE